ncbi:MAG: alpha/beta hydrolase [Rhodocyclaceae bacterium]
MTRNMLLIHGAWQGSWSFAAWLPHLARHGWNAHAIDLPGNGWGAHGNDPASLDEYVAHALKALRGFDGPAVVVGHSGGGITASQLAEAAPERVAALVYLAGMMLPSGLSFGGLIDLCQQDDPLADLDGIAPYLEWSADGRSTQVPAEAARDIFVPDCAPSDAARAAALLRPQPESGRKMVPTLSVQRYGSVPRLYVRALHDRSVVPPLQARMLTLTPGATVIDMDCGHVPQLARPAELAERMSAALNALLAEAASAP